MRSSHLAIAIAMTLLSSASSWAAPPTGKVRSVRRDLVYVDLGRAQGVRAGDTLKGPGGARLEVVALGEKQLVARRVGGTIREGAEVASPREPGAGEAKRPEVTLPSPGDGAETLPWAGSMLRRTQLIPSPGGIDTRAPVAPSGVRGEFIVSYGGMFDSGVVNLDIHQMELRSKLTVEDGRLTYEHDIAGRLELGPNLDVRQGTDSRPYYKVRELMLRYRSEGWNGSAAESPFGAFEGALGRIHLPETPSVGLLDGVRAELALGDGFSAGVHGGVAPRLLDLGLNADTSVVGAHASWAQAGDDWQARATLTTAASFWQGALNRVDLGVTTGLAYGRAVDLYATAVGTMVDDTLLPQGQPAISLSRGFVGVRLRPLRWLGFDAHYAHDRIVADRETLAAYGAARFITDPRESAWLQVRFSPDPMFSLSLSGNLGFGYSSAEQQGGAARGVFRNLGFDASRLAVGYRLNQTVAVRTQVADLDIGLPLGDAVEVGLGYAYTTFQARRLSERQDEHRVSVGLDLLAAGPWRLDLRGEYAFGDLPSQLAIMAQLGWRFR